MRLYVADYLADTRRLTTLEHGAYMLLIMEYWRNRGLPKNDEQLARIAGFSADDERWLSVRSAVAQHFDENWRHERIEIELARADLKSLQAKKAAAKSLQHRGKKRPLSKRSTDAQQTLSGRYHTSDYISKSTSLEVSSEPLNGAKEPSRGRTFGSTTSLSSEALALMNKARM